MNDRNKERDRLYNDLILMRRKVNEAQSLYNSLNIKTMAIKERFDLLDREIAMENRTIITTKKTLDRVTERKFTVDEIREIASRLGVEITIEER